MAAHNHGAERARQIQSIALAVLIIATVGTAAAINRSGSACPELEPVDPTASATTPLVGWTTRFTKQKVEQLNIDFVAGPKKGEPTAVVLHWRKPDAEQIADINKLRENPGFTRHLTGLGAKRAHVCVAGRALWTKVVPSK